MKTSRIIRIILLLFLFIATLRVPRDLDLGWHLRYGEYFFQTGHVLKDNILSSVWPTYKWVEASWGYDLILYQLFTHFGFLGISICGYLICLSVFLILTHPIKKFTLYQLLFVATLFITQTYPLYGESMRAQSLSALFMAYILLFMVKFSYGSSMTKWFHPLVFPVLFFFWANLHGSFFLGLILLTMFWGIWGILLRIKKSLISAKQWVMLGLTIFGSSLPPLINPWGIQLYTESFNHAKNINLMGIIEWMPIEPLSMEWLLGITTVMVVLFFAIKRKNIRDIPFVLLFLLISYMAFSAIRFLIYFGLMATLFVSHHIADVTLPKIPSILLKTLFIGLLCFEALFVRAYFLIPDISTIRPSWDTYCAPLSVELHQTKDCSEEVVHAMLSDIPAGNGYHPYNFGGYLSWRVPQVKTFIDGRMAGWTENGVLIPLDQADQIYIERSPLMFRKFDSEYHFQWLIIPSFSPLVTYIDELTKAGVWELRYRDEFYTYYVKRKE